MLNSMIDLSWTLNTAWMLACRREWRAFQSALYDPAAAQTAVLQRILQANADSRFGRRHGFHGIHDASTFQDRVPAADYDTYREHIDRIAAGEPNVLTAERVRLLEPTSGSTSARKLIPYTDSLRHEFQRMIAVWVYNLLSRRPALRRGRAYWSISPALGPRDYTAGGIPIGFDDDASYLGGVQQWLVRRLLVVPAEAARVADIGRFQYATLLSLLRAEDLTLISIWSPTFLLSLLERIDEWRDRLCDDLMSGADLGFATYGWSSTRQQPLSRSAHGRARQIMSLLRSGRLSPALNQQLWPRLGLISCWADASSAMYVEALRELFPKVEFQPKGLLSTEGCVSVPLLDRWGAPLALRSHFLEFEHASRFHLAHQLQVGRQYEVVLTTGGGLYRYRTKDIVEVVGLEKHCPLIVFRGRATVTSDLVGEKLNEPHVRSVVERVLAEAVIHAHFVMLVPVAEAPARYRLYLQPGPDESLDPETIARVVAKLELGLRENPHYRYAVDLRQLAPCEIRLLDWCHGSAWRVFERQCLVAGQRLGQIKPVVLGDTSLLTRFRIADGRVRA